MRDNVPDSWRRQSDHVIPVSSHCRHCRETFIHERHACPRCGRGTMTVKPASTAGVVESWTEIFDPPEEFHRMRPYIIGLIRLDDGARLSAPIVDVESGMLVKGMRVEAVVRKVYVQGQDGLIEYGTKYRPSMKVIKESKPPSGASLAKSGKQ